ncbi:MAG TPA: BrxE family protein [Bryobacteraceae bacterium]|nr:BrxE family protein [Bryobacteraceae bacterium]
MTEISLLRLFKLRAAVGRFGEMDAAGWWNTQGVLGSRGAVVYKRGLPRTHFFARVRLVSSVAGERSGAVYPAPGVATLWELPPETERALAFQERKWPANGDGGADWTSFETALATPPADNLVGWLTDLDLVSADLAGRVASLPMAPGGKGIKVPGPVSEEAVQFLALAHARSGPKNLLVPFITQGLEVAGG